MRHNNTCPTHEAFARDGRAISLAERMRHRENPPEEFRWMERRHWGLWAFVVCGGLWLIMQALSVWKAWR